MDESTRNKTGNNLIINWLQFNEYLSKKGEKERIHPSINVWIWGLVVMKGVESIRGESTQQSRDEKT